MDVERALRRPPHKTPPSRLIRSSELRPRLELDDDQLDLAPSTAAPLASQSAPTTSPSSASVEAAEPSRRLLATSSAARRAEGLDDADGRWRRRHPPLPRTTTGPPSPPGPPTIRRLQTGRRD